jgi:hypothetical protein
MGSHSFDPVNRINNLWLPGILPILGVEYYGQFY